MTPLELRKIINQREGLKLDFKREYRLSTEVPNGTDQQRWKSYVRGQWDEFIRDILAIANGNIGRAVEHGTLVIGVDDELLPDGTRRLYDTSHLRLASGQILERVNRACAPPLPDIRVEQIEIEGTTVTVITVPPTPHVHETTRQLQTTKGQFDESGTLRFSKPDKTYSEHTVFLRRGDGIYPAQYLEREAVGREKKRAFSFSKKDLSIATHESTPLPEPVDISAPHLSTATITDVLEWGWDGTKLLEALIELDYTTTEELSHAHEGDPSQWGPVFMTHPETWRLLINQPKSIVGYWHMAPLFGEEYEMAKDGQLLDSQITVNTVQPFEFPGEYDSYFVQVCLLPEYRKPRATQMLFDTVFEVFDLLSNDGIFIRELTANAYTRVGEALCKSFNMHPTCPHREHGFIFSAPIQNVLRHPLAIRRPALLHKYSKQGLA